MSITTKERNNFDILRLIFASIVFCYHMGILTGNGTLAKFPGGLAVDCFFAISGYLIVKSYRYNNNLTRYYIARSFRIYPLYFFVVTSSFFVGVFHYPQDIATFLDEGAFKYLAANYLFLNFLAPGLPELFDNNLMNAVNGSLWTIKVEVMFYIAVPILYCSLARKIGLARVTIGVGILSVLCAFLVKHLVNSYSLNPSLNNQLPSLICYFMAGAIYNFIEPRYARASHLIFVVPALYLFSNNIVLEPILIGYFVYLCAFKVRSIGISKKIGDLSYGIYIWHFPVLQLLYSNGFFDNYLTGAITASACVLSLSFASWHIIEKRAIRLGRQLAHANSNK